MVLLPPGPTTTSSLLQFHSRKAWNLYFIHLVNVVGLTAETFCAAIVGISIANLEISFIKMISTEKRTLKFNVYEKIKNHSTWFNLSLQFFLNGIFLKIYFKGKVYDPLNFMKKFLVFAKILYFFSPLFCLVEMARTFPLAKSWRVLNGKGRHEILFLCANVKT